MVRTHQLSALAGLAVAVAFLVVLAPAPAVAAPPVTESFTWSLPPGPLGFCGGTPVMVESVIHGTQTTHFDQDGNVSRIELHAKTEDRLYLEGSDKILEGHASYNVLTLTAGAGLNEGVEKWTGLFWHVVVPGFGTVLLDAGLEVIDWNASMPVLKAVGKHQWLEGDFERLCAALQ